MKKKACSWLTLSSLFAMLAAALLLPPSAMADGPARLNSTDVLMQLRSPMCNPAIPMAGLITSATPLDTLIFNSRGCGPVLAPDGHQLTLGEFKAAQGTAAIKCTNEGTRTVVHFSGLVPGGIYTVWLFLFANGPPPDFPTTAVGALGNSSPLDPIQNSFTASAAGTGQMTRTNTAGVLSEFGPVGNCWLDNPEAQVVLVYHIDGRTSGPVPGPLTTWVMQELFRFSN